MVHPCAALAPLADLDPDLVRRLTAACRRAPMPPERSACREIVSVLIACFEREINFGLAVADGFEALLAAGLPEALAAYSAAVRQDGRHGVGRGRVTAVFLPPVLLTGDAALLAAYHRTVAVLLKKGAYLLPAPLEGLRWLLEKRDRPAAAAYLDLLPAVFDRKLSYNRCQYLGNLLPRALRRLPVSRRRGQLAQLARIAAQDLRLLEPFLEGLERGLHLLADQALAHFTREALDLAPQHFERAVRFLALRAERGRARCRALQTAVPLTRATAGLNRYLQARIRRPAALEPLSRLPGIADAALAGGPLAACDGVTIYLPEEIDRFPRREDNAGLFRLLAKFEAGLIEYDTFGFDRQRAHDLGLIAAPAAGVPDAGPDADELGRFLDGLGHQALTHDLFTVFEHARVRVRLARDYPGLVRRGLPVFQDEFRAGPPDGGPPSLVEASYARLALDLPPAAIVFDPDNPQIPALVAAMHAALSAAGPADMPVEASAALTAEFYPAAAEIMAVGKRPYRPMAAPYRLPVAVAAHARRLAGVAPRAASIARRLAARGFKLYPADLRLHLQQNAGRLDHEDVRALVQRARARLAPGEASTAVPPDLTPSDWRRLDPDGAPAAIDDPDDVAQITWQREWNHVIGDYLHDHVRVRDRRPPPAASDFYREVLQRHQGLVRRIKYAFEMLRPEGLKLLRQWVEGDDFDYRALLDYALDRRAGIMPSERLYIKRLKQRRDVAVLLLVDLSRSTSNIVPGSDATVLDVAKESLVLFSQALEVVGDRYAIAGFSGTGRLGVDYFRIKGFEAALDDNVRGGIGRMTPQRSTRMGAAVRRATRELMAADARVRLLIVIGDGFPNDLEYKQDYAIADTRQAIGEARARQVHTHAITVNIPASPRLDDLYGHVHHTVISDVRELPDQLLRIYSTLTRG